MEEHLIELCNEIEREQDNYNLARVLLNVSTLFDSLGCSDLPGEGRRAVEVRRRFEETLTRIRPRWASNFEEGDVLYTDADRFLHSRFVPPSEWEFESHTWKPFNALWTSPIIKNYKSEEPTSAWIMRAETLGDALPHSSAKFYERRDVRALQIFGLREANDFVSSSNNFQHICVEESKNGIQVIDFSWNVVIEAELAALHGELDPAVFPCSLSVECSLWIAPPNWD